MHIYNATCSGAAAELGENVYFTECDELLPRSTASFGSCNPAFGAEIMVFLCTSCHVSCPGTEPWRTAMLTPLSSGERDSKGCSSGSTAGFSRADTRTVVQGSARGAAAADSGARCSGTNLKRRSSPTHRPWRRVSVCCGTASGRRGRLVAADEDAPIVGSAR